MIPALWCSIFTEPDIPHHEFQGFHIPAPTVETQVARERFAQRRSVLESTFSNFTQVIDEWANLLNGVSERYIKIDATEIWDMGPEEFEEQFPAAIRWFDSQADSDFDQLVLIAGFEYDSSASIIITDALDIAGNHLRGYEWVRAVPWDDA